MRDQCQEGGDESGCVKSIICTYCTLTAKYFIFIFVERNMPEFKNRYLRVNRYSLVGKFNLIKLVILQLQGLVISDSIDAPWQGVPAVIFCANNE